MSTKFTKVFFDPLGNLRTGLTVVVSGSSNQYTLLEDLARPGLYYSTIPAGTYDIYVNGERDDIISPIYIPGPS